MGNCCSPGSLVMSLMVSFCAVLFFTRCLDWTYRGLTSEFLLLRNFSVAISVSPVSFQAINLKLCTEVTSILKMCL